MVRGYDVEAKTPGTQDGPPYQKLTTKAHGPGLPAFRAASESLRHSFQSCCQGSSRKETYFTGEYSEKWVETKAA